MDNSYFDKGASLLKHLARSPGLLPSYLRYLPLWGRQPIDCELPWISFGALRFLDGFVRPEHDVFEYGGGGSTLYFARRARSVLTMENHPDWHAALSAALAARGLARARCEHQVIAGDAPAEFRDSPFFRRIRERTWDIILVDCYCGYSRTRYGELRPYAMEFAFEQLNPGGIIVLDDSWMFPEQLAPRAGWRITDYVGPGPCRYGITSTAILQKLPAAPRATD